jgi:hypothetical protein
VPLTTAVRLLTTVALGACQERSTEADVLHWADTVPRVARERVAEYQETCILARNKRYKHDTAETIPKRRRNIQPTDVKQLHVTYIGDSALAKCVKDSVVVWSWELIRRPVKLEVADMWLR